MSVVVVVGGVFHLRAVFYVCIIICSCMYNNLHSNLKSDTRYELKIGIVKYCGMTAELIRQLTDHLDVQTTLCCWALSVRWQTAMSPNWIHNHGNRTDWNDQASSKFARHEHSVEAPSTDKFWWMSNQEVLTNQRAIQCMWRTMWREPDASICHHLEF